MSLYVISDLHLSKNADKSMEVFGPRWQNYMERLERNWNSLIENDDTVVVPGDISWGLTLEDAIPDLKFVDSLKGKKILGKGNHDFWWQTLAKLKKAFADNGINSIDLLHNNSFTIDGVNVCGTRGWYSGDRQCSVNTTDNQKIINREVIRLKISLDSAKKAQSENNLPIVVFLHFPPVYGDFICREIIDTLHEYSIRNCYFGHIHGIVDNPRTFVFENVNFTLVSSDHLGFTPIPVRIL